MKVTCPHCLQEYDVEETLIEQIVQCEMCSQEFVALEEKQITETVKAKPDIPVKKEKKKTRGPNINDQKIRVVRRPTYKACPMCGETILFVAKKCKFCQTELDGNKVVKKIDYFIYVLLGLFFGNIGLHDLYADKFLLFIFHISLFIVSIVVFFGSFEFGLLLSGINTVFAIIEICSNPNNE
jgi:uncharacterized protein (DUF983 family)